MASFYTTSTNTTSSENRNHATPLNEIHCYELYLSIPKGFSLKLNIGHEIEQFVWKGIEFELWYPSYTMEFETHSFWDMQI